MGLAAVAVGTVVVNGESVLCGSGVCSGDVSFVGWGRLVAVGEFWKGERARI